MNKLKEILLIRYISYMMLLLQFLIINKDYKFLGVVFLLVLIINNHLRIFYMKREFIKSISILIESIAVIPICNLFGGYFVFYLIGVIIDTFMLKNTYVKYILLSIISLVVINNSMFPYLQMEKLILFIIVVFILKVTSELYSSKYEAQNLYDKLRISEDNLKKANEDLEDYADSIEEITLLKERNRISREIHDSVGHALSTAMIQLSAMEAVGEKESSTMAEMAKNLREFINESFKDVKRAVNELKPDEYESYGGVFRLQEVCKNFEKLTGIKVNMIISKNTWKISTKQLQNLQRIAQEFLSNSLRHGEATQVNVAVNFLDEEFIMSFKDNGKGTDKIVKSGLGLKGITERTEEMGGIVEMQSSVGNGFFVKIIVPKEKEI